MRIINITGHIVLYYDNETLGADDEYKNVFQLKCGNTVLVEEEAPYEADNEDLEEWAAEKLKRLFK